MSQSETRTGIKSLLIPFAIALTFLLWGLVAYTVMGDKGTGPWFYGSQPDVPGSSPFATHRAKVFRGSGPPEPLVPRAQHVDGTHDAPPPPTLPEVRP